MNDDWKSLNWKAFLKRGTRMSLRLTPKAQRKKRLVIRMNGATYRFSVSDRSSGGAEFAMLGQCPIQMHIAAVNEKMLAGDVPGPRREKEYYHRGDFLGSGHPLLQWNFSQNSFELFFRVGKSIQPLAVERSHHLRGNDRVYANAVVEQLCRPLAGQRQDCAFRR